jgi:D-sedoheptulose 7-phosphate isomerase
MDSIYEYITDLKAELDRTPIAQINTTIGILNDARYRGAQIFIMGNGGSASTATHFVCDLLKNTRVEGIPSFKVTGLADNLAVVSALANDEGYENIFSQQLSVLLQPQDVVIGISTSGNSPNVLQAVETANRLGAFTIAFTGYEGGQLGEISDLNVCFPSNCIERIEDAHLIFEHIICKVLREQAQSQISLQGISSVEE